MKKTLKSIKYLSLAMFSACTFWAVLFLFLGVPMRNVEFMIAMATLCMNGTAIIFYLDAIYETRNPNQPRRNPD